MNEEVLKDLSYGVYVVTSMDEEKPVGCIANCVMQITYDTIAISIHHDNFTNHCIKNSKRFAISILAEDVNDKIIPIFGFRSCKDTDKFSEVKTKYVDNLPVIEDSVGYLTCELNGEFETVTHTVFFGKIIDSELLSDKTPMTYAYYHSVKKGTSPKNAPTYSENKSSKVGYKCTVCNYVYEGDLTKEPETYVCPICKKPKSFFVKL